MKRFSEQFNKAANQVRIPKAEKLILRERLVAYMEYHPLTADAKNANSPVPLFNNEAYRTVRIDLPLISRFVGAFAVLALIIVPVFAENTIPGDVLYSVKVKFNEEVRSSLIFSPYEKVEWETARLERRIAEAQLLAEAGLLTPEVEAQVAQAVKGHSDAAQKEIAFIGVTDQAEAAIAKITLNTALEVQTEVLANQLAKSNENSSTALPGHSVLAIAAVVDEAKNNNDAELSNENLSPEKLLAYLESETTRAYEYLDSVEPVASVSERNDIRRRLNDINQTIERAVDEESQVADSDLLLATISDIRKLISFMTNIDVRENVSIEDLVPLILTEAEQQEILQKYHTNLEDLTLAINAKLVNVPAALREKFDLSLVRVSELRIQADEAIKAQNFLAAEAMLKEALLIVNDIDQQTLSVAAVVIPDIVVGTTTASGTVSEVATTSVSQTI